MIYRSLLPDVEIPGLPLIWWRVSRHLERRGFAMFASPLARDAAVRLERALVPHTRPAGERVRVRMGIQSGEASWAPGLAGLVVHRVSRIAAVAHGDPVPAAARLPRDVRPDGVG